MLKQVWFHIHGKTPEKMVNIMTKVLSNFKFINVNLIDNKCIIETESVPDSLNSWLIDKLLSSKKFMGQYHSSIISKKKSIKIGYLQMKIQTCISRFGFWDSVDYPEDKVFGNFLIIKTQHMLDNLPLWQAVKLASATSGHVVKEPEKIYAYSVKTDYIDNLIRYHDTPTNEAEAIINKEFPYLADIKEPQNVQISKESIEAINRKTIELIEILKFYSPKSRKNYLEQSNNFDKFLIFASLFNEKGRDWVVDNIGEVESWT